MPDKKIDIDAFFRQQYQQLPPGTDAGTDWAQMGHLLDRKPPRLRKKTTRRIIRYLGGLALVTTVTWYAAKQYRRPAKGKPPVAQAVASKPAAPAMPTVADSKTVTLSPVRKKAMPLQQPVRRFSQQVWRSESDTVLLTPPEVARQEQPVVAPPRSVLPAPATEASANTALHNWLQQLAQPVTTFRIDPKRDTLLLCPQGTVIWVPALSFYNTASKQVEKNTLSLTVKECYQYADMLANRLSTTTPTDALATGGMIHLSAEPDSGQIQPVLFRPLEVRMPMRQYDPAMQLYLPVKRPGADSTIGFDWAPAGQVQTYENRIPFRGRTHIKVMEMQQRVAKGEDGGTNYFEVQTPMPLSEQQIKALLRNRYPLLSGKLVIVTSEQEAPGAVLKGSAAKATQKGFMMQDSLMLPFEQALRQKLLRKQDSLAFEEQRRQEWMAWRKRVEQDSLAYIRRMDFEKAYRFNVGNLGWINCDRLLAPGVPRVEFVIRCAPGEAAENGEYSFVVNSQQSIVRGRYVNGNILFGNLPSGISGQLICVSQQSGKVMSCVRPVQVVAGMALPLQFKETNPAEFRQQLAAMDPALADVR
jgi:hypothetical protein